MLLQRHCNGVNTVDSSIRSDRFVQAVLAFSYMLSQADSVLNKEKMYKKLGEHISNIKKQQ